MIKIKGTYKYRIILMALILLISAIGISTVYGEEKDKQVTILFTHDLHDNLLPMKYIENGTLTNIGGYARLQSAINREKEMDPEAVLVDGGDFSMGTPFQTIFQTDAPGLRILGSMGYDAVTFGNHEFDYRAEGLADCLNAAVESGEYLPQIVQANVHFPLDKDGKLTASLSKLKQSMENYGVKDYIVLERNGVKIGVFGLMGEESASMAPMSEVTFLDEIKEAKRVVKQLKEQEQVDMIICLSHSGTYPKASESEDEILAKEVPEIDVIISGHTHTKLSEPIRIGNTVIGSAENYGMNLGVMKLTQKASGEWELKRYELVRINDTLSEDVSISNRINEFKASVQEKYFRQFGLEFDEVVAYSDIQFQTLDELFSTHAEATIGNLISDAYIYSVKQAEGENYTPVDVAVVPNGTIRGTIFKGEITAADAFSISSLGIGKDGIPGYPLISVYLTGKELITLCEVDASITPIMGEAQLYLSGMNYTFNPNRLIFNKVTKTSLLRSDGTEEQIEMDKLYRVVCNLYSAQMLSIVGDKSYGIMSIVPKTKEGEAIIDFEKQIIYNEADSSKTELKEWYAVVQYLKSFDSVDGIPHIPAYYETTQGRKNIDQRKNIVVLLQNPNGFALAIYIAVSLILALICLIIVKCIKHFLHKGKRK